MNAAEIIAAHNLTMNGITASNLKQIDATSEKLRHVLGDPLAAQRLMEEPGRLHDEADAAANSEGAP